MKKEQPVIKIKDSEVLTEEDEPPGALPQTQPTFLSGLYLFSDLNHTSISEPRRSVSNFKISDNSQRFLRNYFPYTTEKEWNSWEWQLRNCFSRVQELQKILSLSEDEYQCFSNGSQHLPLRVTPYYASLLNPLNPLEPLRRTVIPVVKENIVSPAEDADPLAEESHRCTPALVHRYPDRVLFLVTGFCATYCRYCTRSRLVGNRAMFQLNRLHWEKALSYIESNPAVRDVLLSGGDPFTLPNDDIEYLLKRLSRIPHVEILRIGTKAPVVLPQRITPSLVRMLKRYHPLWISIHFTHPDEITPEVFEACGRLADAGIPLGSQTVLLKGINDDVDTMKKLVHGLLKMRVRPYYLYQCDPIVGSSHFRTSVEKGLEIMDGLLGHTSGYAVPHYVIDAPGGGGKIRLLPEYMVGRQGNDVLLRNYEGKTFRYPEWPGYRSIDSPGKGNCLMKSQEVEAVHYRNVETKLKIGLTYDLREDYLKQGYSEEETAEFDRADTVDAIERSLLLLGSEVERIGSIKNLVDQLSRGKRWDMVFNICEGLKGMGREAQVPAVLEAYNIPCTFSDPLVLTLTLDKALTKRVVRDLGVNTPDFFVVKKIEDLRNNGLRFPLFVKPLGEGTGKGIGPLSRVLSHKQLRVVCEDLLAKFKQPVLVETYLPGREFTVGLVGTGEEAEAVGVIEVILKKDAEAYAYSYRNKENCEDLVIYTLVNDEVAEKCKELALKVWRGLGCRDAGRLDIRLDAAGVPNFLEVNPLAGLHPEHSDLPIICSQTGISYQELIERIIKSALKRVNHGQ